MRGRPQITTFLHLFKKFFAKAAKAVLFCSAQRQNFLIYLLFLVAAKHTNMNSSHLTVGFERWAVVPVRWWWWWGGVLF